jgi:hypothetical protein
VVSHAGARLLADLADRSTLTEGLSAALGSVFGRRVRHDPGRVLTDLAVAVADGAEAISDIATLADQPGLFGAVASDSTVWRLLDAVGPRELAAIATARVAARGRVWAQRAAITGSPVPPARAGGRTLPGLVIDLDSTIVECHSDKELAAGTYKGSFGYAPMLAYLDNTGEALAGLLRPGNAGPTNAADHITVLDAALAQLPACDRRSGPILVRADSAGCSKAFLAHLRDLTEHGMSCQFSVGWRVGQREHTALSAIPHHVWTPAIDTGGEPRDHADIAEITAVLPARTLADYPAGTRVIVRRERPHPGAQLRLFEDHDGWRYTAFATDTPTGQLGFLDARHRAHARVEDRIRCGKDTGLSRLPSRMFAINQAWLATAMIAADLIAWTQTLLLTDQPDLARAEPKTLRYRLLHVAARLTRGARRTWLRIDQHWPWARHLACAFARLHTLPALT